MTDPLDAALGGAIALTSRKGDPKDVRRTRWGWSGWAPLGCFGVIAGDGGSGKGIVTSHVLAAFTKGVLPGDLAGEPVNVAWIGDEDNWNEVILPRLIAAGADVDRVFKIDVPKGEVLDVVRDIPSLEAKVEEHDLRAIAFEAIADHIHVVDEHRNGQVRTALAPLRDLAREKQLLALATTHLTKNPSTSYNARVMGATALLAVARVGWLVGRSGAGGRRALAFGKGNVGPWPTTLTFDIEGTDVHNPVDPMETPNVGFVMNLAEAEDLDAETILAGPQREKDSGGKAEVKEFLQTVLADGPVKAVDLLKEAEEAGIAERTLKRYKAAAGAESVRVDGAWLWQLKPKGATGPRAHM
jgi:hypothetical protein